MIIWITGVSGAGKTSVAKALVERLKAEAQHVLWLDGDQIREAIADPQTGYDRTSRLNNAYRLCRLAQLTESQGLLTVVSTMSLFHEIHQWNRAHFQDYFEVLLQVDWSVLQQRQVRAWHGEDVPDSVAENVVGLDIAPELPQSPDLLLENNATQAHFEDILAERILVHWQRRAECTVSG
jgi:adenylylsulfate kinase-like enzyme